MAKLKYYRYAIEQEGKLPKKNMVRMETAPEGYYAMAAYTTLLPDSIVEKYNLVDLNGDVRNLQRLRIMAGYTQQEVADRIGVPIRTYQGWEMGKIGSANLTNSVKLADFFGVKDLRDLLK